MERGQLIDAFKEYAFNNGFKLKLHNTEDGERVLELEMEGLILYVESDIDDVSFLRVVLPNIDQLNENAEKRKAINELNKSYKMGKMIEYNGLISISAEQFVYSLDSINDLYERMLSVLFSMFKAYREKFPIESHTTEITAK